MIFIDVLPVHARKFASTSIILSENGWKLKKKIPISDTNCFFKVSQNEHSLIQKKEEEVGGREETVNPGVIFAWLRIPLG